MTAAAIYKNLDYDPIKSFAPIAMVIYAPQMLAVHPSLPVKSLPELVAYAKSNPGKVTFGSSGLRHAAAHARRDAQALRPGSTSSTSPIAAPDSR